MTTNLQHDGAAKAKLSTQKTECDLKGASTAEGANVRVRGGRRGGGGGEWRRAGCTGLGVCVCVGGGVGVGQIGKKEH